MNIPSNRALLAAIPLICAALAGCGQKGPLYLPDKASDVVTRPAGSSGAGESPDSPRTSDTPPGPANPAPEVTAPKDKNKTTPPKK